MPASDLQRELQKAPPEPLLPIEKKLIGWSLGIGLVLLAVLLLVSHFVPASLQAGGAPPAPEAPRSPHGVPVFRHVMRGKPRLAAAPAAPDYAEFTIEPAK